MINESVYIYFDIDGFDMLSTKWYEGYNSV